MTTGIFQGMIPDSIDEVLDRWHQDDSEQYRLTLLHKNKDGIFCFLSGNLQEVRPEQKIDLGMTLALSRRARVNIHYDCVFHQRNIDSGNYFTFEEDNSLEGKDKVIPFCYEKDLPSTMVDRKVKETLLDYITLVGDYSLNRFEYFAEHNFVEALFNLSFSKEWKERSKPYKEAEKSLLERIIPLFQEESSPSTFIQPPRYKVEDRKLGIMFEESRLRLPIKLYLALPRVAFAPCSLLRARIETELGDRYEEHKGKFGQTEEGEAKILLSEFLAGRPKVVDAVYKSMDLYKHTANMGMYAFQISIAALAHTHTWPILSYPLIAGSVISGLTMMSNFISSKARDSSGLIATLLDRSKFNKVE